MAKRKKHKKYDTKAKGTQVILMPDEERAAEKEDEEASDEEEEESGIYLDKASVQIIYNALSHYTPTTDEKNIYGVLHEQFEEMLVVEYGVRLPGFEFMDEEDE